MFNNTQYAIFSVSRGNCKLIDKDNSAHIEYMMKQLKVPFKVVEDVYEGVSEVSYVTTNIDFARTVATDFNQDCILVSDSNGQCYLESKGKSILELGTMHSVSESEAKQHDSYTTDKYNNYYVTKGA